MQKKNNKTQNYFDINFNFRLANIKEIIKVMQFLSKNWDNKHILTKNKKYFSYYFKNKNKLNIVICLNKKNKKIYSLFGFIKYSEPAIRRNICGSIGCISKYNKVPPLLGLETFKRMIEIVKPKTYFGIGTNPKNMIPLVSNYLKHFTGKMNHYYILNKNYKKNEFKIAKINQFKFNLIKKKNDNSVKVKEIFLLKEINLSLDLNKGFKDFPYKNFNYIKKRYFDHPIFKYRFFSLEKKTKKALLIARVVVYKSSSVFRIIDYIGNKEILNSINQWCTNILSKENHEYVDLLCTGIQHTLLKKSGFIYKNNKDKNIIPDYFQPFLRKNVEIWYEKKQKKLILFKGDADQDTPRI